MAIIYLAICALLYFQQDQMVFVPPTEYEKVTPLKISIPFEDLLIPVNGSEQIHAWWIPASSPSNKVVLSFHGNASVLEDNITVVLRAKSGLAPLPRLPTKQMELIPLHELGVNVLAIDYRGLGSSSSGLPNEKRSAFMTMHGQHSPISLSNAACAIETSSLKGIPWAPVQQLRWQRNMLMPVH